MKIRSCQKELRKKYPLRTEARDYLPFNRKSLSKKSLRRKKRCRGKRQSMLRSSKQKKGRSLRKREGKRKRRIVKKQ